MQNSTHSLRILGSRGLFPTMIFPDLGVALTAEITNDTLHGTGRIRACRTFASA
jgi:hypothetical protein